MAGTSPGLQYLLSCVFSRVSVSGKSLLSLRVSGCSHFTPQCRVRCICQLSWSSGCMRRCVHDLRSTSGSVCSSETACNLIHGTGELRVSVAGTSEACHSQPASPHNRQAGSLILFGPVIDKLLCGSFPHTWGVPVEQKYTALGYVALSCSLAVGVNYSQVS